MMIDTFAGCVKVALNQQLTEGLTNPHGRKAAGAVMHVAKGFESPAVKSR